MRTRRGEMKWGIRGNRGEEGKEWERREKGGGRGEGDGERGRSQGKSRKKRLDTEHFIQARPGCGFKLFNFILLITSISPLL